MTEKKMQEPKSMDLLGEIPGELASYLRSRGVATCEQVYEQVVLLLQKGTGHPLPTGIEREHLVQLRERLEGILSGDVRARLSDSARVRWTDIHPPGVLPPSEWNRSQHRVGAGENKANSVDAINGSKTEND